MINLQGNSSYKAFWWTFSILVILCIGLFSIPNISSADWDNIKEININKMSLGYPEITLKNSLLWVIPLSPILDTRITTNTPRCANGFCNTELTFNNYKSTSPIEDIRFIDINGNEVENIPYSLYTYETENYIEKVIDYEKTTKICDEKKSIEEQYKYCDWNIVYKDVEKTRQIKVDYKLGDEYLGDKIVGINADISGYNFIDYQMKSNGIWLEEYVVWTIADCYGVGGNDLYLDGDFCVHTFTTNGTFNMTDTEFNVSVLVVAGGGSGGGNQGGGGGSGGIINNTLLLVNANVTVSIGVGAPSVIGSADGGINGADSIFGALTAIGGGAGGSNTVAAGSVGGSGGGGGGGTGSLGGSETINQGNSGGDGPEGAGDTGNNFGGGGGAGSQSAVGRVGGAGGDGGYFNINGTDVYFAGGGGGAGATGSTGGAGGLGGGGAGASEPGVGTAGLPNTGGGGGGVWYSGANSGAGGSGIVIVRYELIDFSDVTAIQSYPPNNTNTTDNTIDIGANFTSIDFENITTAILRIYNASYYPTYSNTISGLNVKSYNATWTTPILTDGGYNWSVEGRGDLGHNATTANWTFLIDTTSPTVSITYVPDGTTITENQATSNNFTFTFNWTAWDALTLGTCIVWNGTGNNSVTCADNTSLMNLTYGNHQFIFWANDSFGNENSALSNFTWTFNLLENSQTYNETTYETTYETFGLNITNNLITILSVNPILHYNGTEYPGTYSCVGSDCNFKVGFDLPLLIADSELHNLFWELNIYNGTGSQQINSSTRSQNVSNIHLEVCDATWINKTLNFTVYDEINLTRQKPFTFDGDFNFWIGTGIVKQNNSFSNSSAADFPLCMFPNNTNFKIDATIEYNTLINLTYTPRNYYFQNDIINSTLQHTFMYLLESSKATSFIIKVQDANLLPLSEHLVYIQRYFPGEGVYKTIQIVKTDDNGQSVAFFETETVDYRFIVTYNGVTLLTTSSRKIFGETAPFTITLTIGENLGEPWGDFNSLEDLNLTLTWNKTSNIVTFTYIDTSETFESGRLLVVAQNFSSYSSNICNTNSSESASIITCDVGLLTSNETGSYTATAYITRAGVETIVRTISFRIESLSDIFGMMGIFLGWMIIMVAAFSFIWNEIAGIWVVNTAIIFVNLIGLVSFGLMFITAILAVSIIITVLLSKK